MLINMLKLVVFIKIVELGSFSKAADSLGISPPAVSKQLRDLERFLKVRLLRRSTRSLELTKAGESAYKYFGKMINNLDEFCEFIPSLENSPYERGPYQSLLSIRKEEV